MVRPKAYNQWRGWKKIRIYLRSVKLTAKLVEGEISEVPVNIRTHGFVQATRIEENIYGQFYIGQSVKNYRKNQE